MFANLDGWKLLVLLLVAIFVLGPERLPKAIGNARRVLGQLRRMAHDTTEQLSREMGTQVDIRDLHPKTFVRKHLLSEEDEALLRRPFEDVARDVGEISRGIGTPSRQAPAAPPTTTSHTGSADIDAT